jgi:hypothetical protein
MFKKSPAVKQFSIANLILSFFGHIQKIFKRIWAEYFSRSIFTMISEECFKTLYGANFCKPNNTPVNILVGHLNLEELKRCTDGAMIASLYFDYRVRYWLGISDFDNEQICINNIGNFRKRLYRDASENDCDLFADRYCIMPGTPYRQALGDCRAGVDGALSFLCRVYGVDNRPVRGLVRSTIWDYGKMTAYKIKLFFKCRRKNGSNTLSCFFIFNTINCFILYF